MAAKQEMQDMVARALCRDNDLQPCTFCAVQARLAVSALVVAGYIRLDIEDLIEASSLGTPGAKALRDSVSDERVQRVLDRAREIEALCNCDRIGVGPDLHHPNCDVNLPADKRSGRRHPETDDGAVEPPATPRAVPCPAARAGEAGWRPAPSSPTTDGGAASPPADQTGQQVSQHLGSGAAAERATSKAAPSSVLPRPFLLFRTRDVTGLSGTGVVAWGCEWPDGTASLRWATEHPSTVAWPSVDDILAVHGHMGATVIKWLDGES